MPNLGVVTAGDTTFTVADVPGLIEGASEGRGLGHDFLRHIERCAALVHVIDTATIEPGRDPRRATSTSSRTSCSRYGGLEDRPRLVALNKIDVPDGRDLADMVVDELRERGLRVFPVSRGQPRGAARADLRDGRDRGAARAPSSRGRRGDPDRAAPAVRRRRRPSSPSPQTPATGWRVRGEKPERWVRQTDFSNDEAVGFLADRLNRLGVEDRLLELGAEEGDAVLIGDPDNAVVFDFKPGDRRRRRDARPPRRGPALRRDRVPPPAAAARSTRRWPTAARARPAPTSPAALDQPETSRPDVVRRSARPTTPTGDERPGRMSADATRGDRRATRVVVKVGSSSLTTAAGGIDPARVRALVDVLAGVRGARRRGRAGLLGRDRRRLAPLGLRRRPRDLATQQAAASVGQGLLVHRYTEELARHGWSPARCCSPSTT